MSKLRAVTFDAPTSLDHDGALTLAKTEWQAARAACIEAYSGHLLGRFLDGRSVNYVRLKSLRGEARLQVEKLTRVVDALDRAIIAMERYDASHGKPSKGSPPGSEGVTLVTQTLPPEGHPT